MSSSPTALISTTASSTSSPSLLNADARPVPPAGGAAGSGTAARGPAPAAQPAVSDICRVPARAVLIACGALSGPIREMVRRRSWPVELHSLPSLLHNRPDRIVPSVERLAVAALDRGLPVAVAYADCGTYGALDGLCERLGLRRLPGLHCYDLLAGPSRVAALFDAEPGTYVLTDFLVRSFRRSVLAELGLDRYPELWPDYFGHYRRLVWLAQRREPALEAEAHAVAAMFGLPLTVIDTGTARLERELARLLSAATAPRGLASTTSHIDYGPRRLSTPPAQVVGDLS